MARSLRYYGDPILRQKAEPIRLVTDDIRELAREMLVAMYRADGIGLAAPQLGVLKRLIVVDPDPNEHESQPLVMANPVIEDERGEWIAEEGCLSLPDIHGDVPRAESIVVSFTTLDGAAQTLALDDWPARIVQHETDHLDGALFIDRISPAQKLGLKNALNRLKLATERGEAPPGTSRRKPRR